MSSEDLRVAVIGMGKMGIVHSCVLNVLPGVKLVAVCEKSGIIRRFLKKLIKEAIVVEDVEKLAESDVDAVYITTPIPAHSAIARIVYDANIAMNVFVEKTLANTYAQSEELCKLAQNSNGIDMVGYLRRFYVTFRKAKDLLAEGVLGELSSFDVYAYSSDFLGVHTRARTSASAARGGLLRDLGCHALDLALWYFGDLKVEPSDMNQSSLGGIKDILSFQATNSDGLGGKFGVSWSVEGYRMPEVGVSINGAKGTLEVNDDRVRLRVRDGQESTWYRHDLNDSVPFWLGLPEYYREDLHFVQAVMAKRKVEPDFASACKVDEMIKEVEKLGE